MISFDGAYEADAALYGRKAKPNDINDRLAKAADRVREMQEREQNPEDPGDYVLSGAKLRAVLDVRESLAGHFLSDAVASFISRELATGRLSPDAAPAAAKSKLAELEAVAKVIMAEQR